MNAYIIANGIILILAIVGSFVINKFDEGFWMGMNSLFTMIYIAILVVVAIIVNVSITIINLAS